MENTLGFIPLKRAKYILDKVEKEIGEEGNLTFEFFMSSFYPTIFQTIQDKIKDERTKAYIEGYNKGKHNRKRR